MVARKRSLSYIKETNGDHRRRKLYVTYGKNVMGAQMLEVTIGSRNGMLRLERDAWSIVKWLGVKSTNYSPLPSTPSERRDIGCNDTVHGRTWTYYPLRFGILTENCIFTIPLKTNVGKANFHFYSVRSFQCVNFTSSEKKGVIINGGPQGPVDVKLSRNVDTEASYSLCL